MASVEENSPTVPIGSFSFIQFQDKEKLPVVHEVLRSEGVVIIENVFTSEECKQFSDDIS